MQSHKITISLFPDDNERLTAIQLSLARNGRRVSASHIIRLALRTMEVTKAGTITPETADRLLSLLDAMKDEDGRVKRFK